jgi:tripartite ATP-independent transporter DctM subunit
MTISILLVALLALAAMGTPLVFAMLGASMLTLLLTRPELPVALSAQLFVSGLDTYSLLAVALFFLAGEFMGAGGTVARILGFARSLVGHMRGGLGQVGVVSSVVMSGVSGSSVADAAAIGPVLIKSMRDEGYPAPLAASIVAVGATLGPIIPPSILMIIYAVLADASIGALFLAGIVPGLLIALGLSVTFAVIAQRRELPRSARATFDEIIHSTVHSLLALVAPVVIIAGVRGGIFTATEAGAVAAVYVMAISVIFYRELGLRGLLDCCVRAAQGTSVVMVLFGASTVFAWIVAEQQIGTEIAGMIEQADLSYWMVLLSINLVLLVAGAFLDPIAAMIIFVPVLLPIALAIGIDPVHFGIILTLNLTIGLLTPPVGILIFMTGMMAKTPAISVMRALIPFIAVLIAILMLITYVPVISLGLPNWIRGV